LPSTVIHHIEIFPRGRAFSRLRLFASAPYGCPHFTFECPRQYDRLQKDGSNLKRLKNTLPEVRIFAASVTPGDNILASVYWLNRAYGDSYYINSKRPGHGFPVYGQLTKFEYFPLHLSLCHQYGLWGENPKLFHLTNLHFFHIGLTMVSLSGPEPDKEGRWA
jgi:hypothetical protein